jgi:hypothetical protein
VAALTNGFLPRERRQDIAAAHAHHLRPAGVYRAGRPWDMGEVFWILRVGYVEYRRPIRLHLTGERIETQPGMVGHIGYFAVTLMNYERLISRSPLQFIVAHQLHVPGRLFIPRARRWWRG